MDHRILKSEFKDNVLDELAARTKHNDYHNGLKELLAKSFSDAVHQMNDIWPDTIQAFEGTLSGSRAEALALVKGDELFVDDLEYQLLLALKMARRNIAFRRANLAPVNSLPQDILCQVFRWASCTMPTCGEDAITTINISQTCSSWRTIARENPSLWTTLDLTTLTRAQASVFVQNSKLKPLSVSFQAIKGRPAVPWITGSQVSKKVLRAQRLEFLHGLLPNISVLDFEFQDSGIPVWFVKSKAPRLETVNFTLHKKGDTLHTLVLSDFLGSTEDSRLRSLTLSGVFVSWNCLSLFRSLSHLNMDFSNRRVCSQASDACILSMFFTCCELRNVSLICHTALQQLPEPPCDPIAMPLLRSLSLEMRSSDAAFLLRSLALPKDMAQLQVLCTEDAEGVDRSLLPVHAQCLPYIATLTGLIVTPCRISGFKRRSTTPPPEKAPFALSFSSKLHGYPADAAFKTLLEDYCPMPQLTHIIIHTTVVETDLYEHFVAFLRHCPSVVEVSIRGDNSILLQKLAIHLPEKILPRCPGFTSIKLSEMKIPLPVLEKLAKAFFKDPLFRVALVKNIVPVQNQKERRYLRQRVGSSIRTISAIAYTTSILSNSKVVDILWDAYEIS
ncbi:hypothetical protein BXZ70DRAFT_938599 [Cristinia sonorae]|uniref:F-box domain-containing protein n=1 Tax=Cristinia sonorae TaxID=1940300 RepID=A0A8K0UMC7_9AGAR|nr:hypothetical protein BXZ70DRAFT_938599 [Cristinia sonorae]